MSCPLLAIGECVHYHGFELNYIPVRDFPFWDHGNSYSPLTGKESVALGHGSQLFAALIPGMKAWLEHSALQQQSRANFKAFGRPTKSLQNMWVPGVVDQKGHKIWIEKLIGQLRPAFPQ